MSQLLLNKANAAQQKPAIEVPGIVDGNNNEIKKEETTEQRINRILGNGQFVLIDSLSGETVVAVADFVTAYAVLQSACANLLPRLVASVSSLTMGQMMHEMFAQAEEEEGAAEGEEKDAGESNPSDGVPA